MAHIEVEEIGMVSDISEGSSNGEGLLPKPIRGVRNGSLPPFVINLYDLVSNKATDSIISWVRDHDLALTETQVHGGATSFTIRNEHDFISNLLPKMSKSNNFDSFITQLNNYKLERESKELDLELNKFKEYVDDTIANQKRIVQAMANVIKSTFGQHHDAHCAHMSNEQENDNKG
ncbi:hypothetical protein L2E82_40117 [Cichorium intybus]|uniref:Uncharacterized protein n=1 Tax=Cichorium intybus TaxID=13427 RepID=A0ACB9AJE0_CICIN|nr:hypothetical protein L2E82_40117 [Cichorium intybus]